jgi:hypothetical protein
MANKGIIGKHSNNGVSEDLTSDWLKREKNKKPKKISPHSLQQMAKFQEITNGS